MPTSRESWQPSGAGWVDEFLKAAHLTEMNPKITTFALRKVLICLSLLLALVLSPPSAAHAASGLSNTHKPVTTALNEAVANHSCSAMSSSAFHNEVGSVSKSDDTHEPSSQCCSGVCLSVVLNETVGVLFDKLTTDKFVTLHTKTDSIEPSGFLRPPQLLI